MRRDDVEQLLISPGQVISVALIEDNRLVREGIAALLNQLPDLRVVAGESSADMALLRELSPQVILLDLGLHNGNSLSKQKELLINLHNALLGLNENLAALATLYENTVDELAAGHLFDDFLNPISQDFLPETKSMIKDLSNNIEAEDTRFLSEYISKIR